jgi:hypothetical protein
MIQNLKTENPDPHSKMIQNPPVGAAETATAGLVKADSIEPDAQNVDLNVGVKIENELHKGELIVLLLLVAAMMILTAVAGCLLWKKISLT